MNKLVSSLIVFAVLGAACSFDTPKGLTNKGKDSFVAGNTEEAIAFYNKALAMDADYVPALVNLALALEGNGQHKEAIALYQKVIKLQPKNALAYNNMASAETSISSYDLALLHANKAIELDKKYDSAYVNRGTIYYFKGDLKKAAADYSKAIELGTKRPIAYYNYGVIAQKSGDLKQALRSFEKALNLNFTYLPALHALGEYYFAQKNWEKALTNFANANAVKSNWEFYYKQAYCEFMLGKPYQAITLADLAISMKPDAPEPHALKGDVIANEGFYNEAYEAYKKARGFSPDKKTALIYDKKMKSLESQVQVK